MYAELFSAVLALYVVNRAVVFYQARRDVGHIPGFYAPFGPFSLIGVVIPTNWWNPGLAHTFTNRKSLYQKATHKTMLITPILTGEPMLYSSSLHVFRQTLAVNSVWQRPELALKDLRLLGDNVFASVGETWKRHRRVLAPAFTQSMYRNVWETSEAMFSTMSEDDGWNERDVVHIDDINNLTRKVTLYVIAICGFGLPMSWSSPERDEKGRMSIEKMAFEVANNIMVRSRTPKWMYYLGLKQLSVVDEAYTTFVERMQEMVHLREHEIAGLRTQYGSGTGADISDAIKDIFGRLVGARMGEGKLSLTDEECIADSFIMLLAGHETTANTLTATIVLLGLYQDEQERVYRVIKDVIGDRKPNIDDYDKLDEVLACFCEALRMFPPAYLNFRQATEDTTLMLPRQDNPDVVDKVHFKKGTYMLQDYVGIGYDSESFPEPEVFRPTRWTTDSPYTSSDSPSAPPYNFASPSNPSLPPVPNPSTLDTFHGFSTGPRTCLGHKFAKTEAVCLLTNLLREWRVEVDTRVVGGRGDEKGKEYERLCKKWREEFMAQHAKFMITFSFPDLPVKFVRR